MEAPLCPAVFATWVIVLKSPSVALPHKISASILHKSIAYCNASCIALGYNPNLLPPNRLQMTKCTCNSSGVINGNLGARKRQKRNTESERDWTPVSQPVAPQTGRLNRWTTDSDRLQLCLYLTLLALTQFQFIHAVMCLNTSRPSHLEYNMFLGVMSETYVFY